MKRQIILAAAAAAPTLAVAAPAHAAVLSLTASRDNVLFEDPTGSLSNGQGPGLFVGKTSGALIRRSLIAFDLTPLRAGARINSVSLSMMSNQPHTSSVAIDLHRVTSDWGEGASNSGSPGGFGAPSMPGDATWLHTFFDTSFWTAPGGDYDPTVSATASVGAAGPYTWSSTAQLVTDMQQWVHTPSSNFGWMLRAANEVPLTTAKRFASSEDPAPANRPIITVDYNLGGDATLDDRVNVNDFTVLAANFNQSDRTFEQGDFNLDTLVNVNDFTILASNFNVTATGPNGEVTPQDWANLAVAMVPEPGSGALAMLGTIATMRRWRRRS